ncbi:hypothetical protein MMYC01_203445 [Madurella mycetomatis]|uniref:CENP-V/GFA domain-containing protein n=1 Tax=Madurella mycetomatis TaxID=100816 RepID=A0A175W8T3_9PEZI|nr:hypothetical protein MMYC01_203445 [Madurella mycetomatis]
MAAELHLPHQLTGANKSLTAQCHCKSVHFIVTVPTSALPLPVHLCHCRICRYTHGTLCTFHAPLPKGIEPQFIAPSSIASSLTGYTHAGAAAERFFCRTCGCHVGDRNLKPDPETGKPEWHVATSIFSSHGEDTFQIRTHIFTNSAGGTDGPNLAAWLPRINNRNMHIWNPAPNDPKYPLSPSPPSSSPTEQSGSKGEKEKDTSRLQAQCHCAGISFTIPRPTASESTDPFLSRFLHITPTPTIANEPTPQEAGHQETAKRVATLCLCADCRLTSGAHAVPWTFVPRGGIRPRLPADLAGDDGYGTLRTYRSSDRVTRGFCRVCGATALYMVDDPERVAAASGEGKAGEEDAAVVDVAVGLLRSSEGEGEGGPAAEGWLAWRTGRLAGWETGREFDAGFAEGLQDGLGQWARKRYGRVEDFEIPKQVAE